jgi:translation elongation factor P/translation initiation factor 5A
MGRKKFIKNQLIEVNGKKVEVSIFGTAIKPGDKNVLGNIEELLEEEKVENVVKNILDEIEQIALKYPDKKKNLRYYYEVGKMLQFVDKEGYTDMRGLIWERMAHDFNPELFGGEKKVRSESKRHPEFMYLLCKISEILLEELSWDQWYEVMKFKEIYKNESLLRQIISECKKENLSGIPLRNKIKELRKKK